MKIKKNRVIFLKKILLYVWVLLIILDCRSIYAQIYPSNYNMLYVCGGVSILNVLYIYYNHGFKLKKRELTYFMVLAIPLLLFCLVQARYNVNAYLRVLIIFGCIVFYLFKDSNKTNMLMCYSNIMFVIATISLTLWILGPQFGIIKSTGTVPVDWGGVQNYSSYYGLLFVRSITPEIFMGYSVYKNIGIFVEPPIYMYCLLLALSINLFFLKKKSFWRNAILILSVLSTFSTLGYVLLILMIVSYFCIIDAKRTLKVLRLLIFPAVFLVVASLAKMLIVDKLSAINVSGLTHIDDFRAGFLCWLDAPILGHGYETREYEKYMSAFRQSNLGLSNGFFYILDQGGLLLFLPVLGPVILSSFRCYINKRNNEFVFFIFFLLLWSVVVAPLRLVSLMICAYAFLEAIGEDDIFKRSV